MSEAGDSILKLRVSPNSSRSEVVGWHGDALRVRVAVQPHNGKANFAVVDTLATYLGIPARDIEIVRGHGSRDKLVRVSGLDSLRLIGLIGIPSDSLAQITTSRNPAATESPGDTNARQLSEL